MPPGLIGSNHDPADRDLSNWNLFGVFAGIGTVLVIIACKRSWRAWRTRLWRATEGTIIAASWQLKSTGEDSVTHELLVSYSYVVDGTRYTASRVALGERSHGAKKDADAAVARYAPGTRVTVFHGRLRPEQAVLEREKIGVWTVFMALAGIAIFVLGGILFPAETSTPEP